MKGIILRASFLIITAVLLSGFLFSGNDNNSKKTVGVILPLSGKFKPYGLKLLKGVEMASNIYTGEGSQKIEYIIRDYGSDETRLSDIIEDLDRDNNVIAILGPMGTQACRTALKKGIPTFIYSKENLVSQEGSCCYGNYLTIGTQVSTLLKTARNQGIKRFALLSPSDAFGRTFRDVFIRTAQEYNIEVVFSQEYADDTKDFSNVVRLFRDTMRKQKKPGKQKPANTQIPSIEAVMIPDTATNASTIAAYFPYYGIKDVRLFGTDLWDTPDFTRLGGKNIEEACFVSGFYAESSSIMVRDFVSTFSATFDSTPTIWEASAYDTTCIIRQMIEKGAETRSELNEAISSLKDYQGATGIISFYSDGSTRREITVLTVRDGSIIEVMQ
jgi:branched-chain amino acid transport system substrate-binding protein